MHSLPALPQELAGSGCACGSSIRAQHAAPGGRVAGLPARSRPDVRPRRPSPRARPWSGRRASTKRVLLAGSGPVVLLGEYRSFGLADPAPRDTPYEIFDFSSVGVEPARVQTEKGEQDHEPDALVPVYKRAISHDVEEMGRGHLMEVFVQEPPFKGRGGCSQGRLQEAEVPDARPPSISLDLVRVERDHLVERQEDDLHESASRLKTPPYCRCASATMRFSRAVLRRSRTGVITITSPSVETSSGVYAPIWARSSRGLSSTSARLFPVFVSFLSIGFSVLTKSYNCTYKASPERGPGGVHARRCLQLRQPSM